MRTRRRWTEADDAQLQQLAASGISRIEIARQLNRTVGATEVRAGKLGIQLPVAAGFEIGTKN
jgi:hypothetical protein